MTGHPSSTADVLVVGAGPAGTATAVQLARGGHRVMVIERGTVPLEEQCGSLLTPRALTSLAALGLDPSTGRSTAHRVDRVRLTTAAHSISTTWPDHPSYPDHGLVVRLDRLDGDLVDAATDAGAVVLRGHEATAPVVERGFVRGASVTAPDGTEFEIRAELTVVADGANSRFGRALGTFRQPNWPFALAHRASFRSVLDTAAEIELIADLTDRSGTAITGFGWMFPAGDGTISVGVVMMSTSPSFQVVNPIHLHQRFVAEHAERWHLDPHAGTAHDGGRIPMGTSVGPAAGPTYVLVGDAVGAANPFTGAGIEAALETGLLAAEVMDDAIRSGTSAALQRYPQLLADQYGTYHQLGRLTTRVLRHPALSTRLGRLVARSRPFGDVAVRIAANELRAGRGGLAEAVYRLGRAASLVSPES